MNFRLRSWLALTVLFASACAEHGPLEDVELSEWCEEAVAPQFGQLELEAESAFMGPCGHALAVGAQTVLVMPDGRTEVFEERAEDHPLFAPRFAPTGRLLAWTDPNHTKVTLRSLDEEPTIRSVPLKDTQEVSKFGFVRSREGAGGAQLWTCSDQVLRAHLLAPARDVVLDEQVWCESVEVGAGSSRIAYGKVDGALQTIDVDTQETATIAKGFEHEGYRNGGDQISTEHGGRLIVYRARDTVLTSEHVEERAEVSATVYDLEGEELVRFEARPHQYEPTVVLMQAPRLDAPLFLLGDEHVDEDILGVVDLSGAEPSYAAFQTGHVYAAALDREGGGMFASSMMVLRFEAGAPHEPEELVRSENIRWLELASDGSAASWFEVFYPDQILLTTWTEAGQLHSSAFSVPSFQSFELLASFPNGSVLISIDDEQRLLSATHELLDTFDADDIQRVVDLDPARSLLLLSTQDTSELSVLTHASGTSMPWSSLAGLGHSFQLDGRAQRLLGLAEGKVHWGALP